MNIPWRHAAVALLVFALAYTLISWWQAHSRAERYSESLQMVAATLKDAKRLLVQADALLAEGQRILRVVTDERGKAEIQRDAALRMVDRLRAQKPTLEAVRRA